MTGADKDFRPMGYVTVSNGTVRANVSVERCASIFSVVHNFGHMKTTEFSRRCLSKTNIYIYFLSLPFLYDSLVLKNRVERTERQCDLYKDRCFY